MGTSETPEQVREKVGKWFKKQKEKEAPPRPAPVPIQYTEIFVGKNKALYGKTKTGTLRRLTIHQVADLQAKGIKARGFDHIPTIPSHTRGKSIREKMAKKARDAQKEARKKSKKK